MKEYKVTGCIVTYNNKDKIDRTIESILHYTKGVDFTLYISDNNSSDGTAEHIKQKYPQVVVIENKTNEGFGAGHNEMLAFMDSKYHVVINPDIIFDTDVITTLCQYCDEHDDVGMLSPQIRFENGKIQHLGKKNPTFRYLGAHFLHNGDEEDSAIINEYCMFDRPQDEPFEITNATGCFMFFRSSIFQKLGGFDERFFMYLEDCDIARRASEITKVLHFPLTYAIHLWERESKRNYKLLRIHIQSIIKYFLKWGIKL